jgi:hypothetical protein
VCIELRPSRTCLSEVDSDGHAVGANKIGCRTWSDACRHTITARLLTLAVLDTAHDVLIARYSTHNGDGRTASADGEAPARDDDTEQAQH